MPTAQPYLEITDGVTSVKLMDPTLTTPTQIATLNYRLSFGGWAPKIAQRNKGPFGLPYLPVMEDLTIDIRGSTPDQALAKLQALNTLLDQGERWLNNEVVNPVFVKYQPKGSVKTSVLQDVIIGRGYGDQTDGSFIDNPPDFNVVGNQYWIKGIRVKFWRKNGVWLCEQEDQTVLGVSQPGPMTVTFSDFANILSPIDIVLGAASGGTTNLISGFLVVTHDDRYIDILEGAQGVTARSINGAASTADAAHNATNGVVGRTTAAVTTAALSQAATAASAECEYLAVFAAVRNNSTTIDIYLQASIFGGAQFAPEIKLAAASPANPKMVFLGIFPTLGRQISSVEINYRSASGTPTLDVDSVYFIGINRATNIIAINNTSIPVFGTPGPGVDGIYLYSQLLSKPQAVITRGLPADSGALGLLYTGSANNFTGSNASVKKASVALLAVDNDRWLINNTAYGAVLTLSMNVHRYKAYLVPE